VRRGHREIAVRRGGMFGLVRIVQLGICNWRFVRGPCAIAAARAQALWIKF
jgi:hypothetical protein